MTGRPVRARITGPEATLLIEQIRKRMTLVSLNDSEYAADDLRRHHRFPGGAERLRHGVPQPRAVLDGHAQRLLFG